MGWCLVGGWCVCVCVFVCVCVSVSVSVCVREMTADHSIFLFALLVFHRKGTPLHCLLWNCRFMLDRIVDTLKKLIVR